jgi:membrane fusion protein, heavy metal efflux system
LIVRSPIHGEIVENNNVTDKYLKEDTEPVTIVAELSKGWIIDQLKEKVINSVHKSYEAEIRISDMVDFPIKGKVFHIGEILDKATRYGGIYVLVKRKNNQRDTDSKFCNSFQTGSSIDRIGEICRYLGY